MTYTLLQIANRHDSSIPGYQQHIDVLDEDLKWCGAWYFPPNGDKIVDNATQVLVQERVYTCDSVHAALQCMINYLGGFDE